MDARWWSQYASVQHQRSTGSNLSDVECNAVPIEPYLQAVLAVRILAHTGVDGNSIERRRPGPAHAHHQHSPTPLHGDQCHRGRSEYAEAWDGLAKTYTLCA